ncbi:lymphocyte antigen 6K isoform 3 precursor, partial [Daubentonia madagascariensis]
QCLTFCPAVEVPEPAPSKRFVLVEPTPFLYILCC